MRKQKLIKKQNDSCVQAVVTSSIKRSRVMIMGDRLGLRRVEDDQGWMDGPSGRVMVDIPKVR